jgi:hypothetical protein
MLKRLLKRGETSGRIDDNAETIKKRFKTFLELSYPVVEHFRKKGKVHTVRICPVYLFFNINFNFNYKFYYCRYLVKIAQMKFMLE